MKLSRLPRLLQRQALPLLVSGAIGMLAATAHAQSNSKTARFYEDALVRYEKKDIEGAIIQLKNALQIDPNLLPVQLLLGKALMQNGEVAAAQVAYTEALRLGVNRAEIVIPLGQAYLAQGKHRLVLEQPSFNPVGLPPDVQLRVHLLRASTYGDLGDARNALRSIDEARALNNRSPDVWFAEVPIRIRAGQLKEATLAADKGLALAPNSAEGLYQKGSIAHVQGELRNALAAYDKALQADASHVDARVTRIGIYMDLARFDDAAKDVGVLLIQAPDEPRGAYLKALLAERKGDTAAVQEALKQVTELLDPVPPEFVRYRPQLLMLNGLAHFGLNEREKAKGYLEAFQKVQGNSPVAKLLARIYLTAGDAAKAVSVIETYLKAQPGDGQAMTLLASANMALGRNAKATALMQEALKTQDNPAYRTTLGLSLIGSGQSAIGITELEAAYKKDPGQTQAAQALVELYLKGNQASKGVSIAEGLVKLQPANASYHNLLGMVQGQSGNIAAARASFEKAIKLDDNLTFAKLNMARLEIATKAYDAAALRLNDLLKVNERNSEAMYELSVMADRKGQPAEAQRWLEKARDAANPKDLRWGLALVDFHLRNGRPGPALDAAKIASGRAPEDLATLMAYSRALLASGDTVGAKNILSGATRFAEYNAPKQVEIAALQMAANNPSGAAYSLEKALSSQPDYLPAQALMAEAEFRLGESAKAEKRAREIVAQNPKRAVGYRLLGGIALAKGQVTPAIDSYRRAFDLEPSTETVLLLFRALSSQEGGKPAQQLAEQWLKTNPRDLPVRKALGDAFVRQANFPSAQIAYEAALKVNPDDADALNNLANVHLRLKNPTAAVKTAELALAKAPGNAAVIDTLGWALLQSGDNDRALQLLRDARLRQPSDPEIRFHLATVLAKTGRKNEAKEELEAALKGGKNFESAAEAAKLLQAIQ